MDNGDNRRSIAETAMSRGKPWFEGQVAEALAMMRALNKMTKAGMPESVSIIGKESSYDRVY